MALFSCKLSGKNILMSNDPWKQNYVVSTGTHQKQTLRK